MQTNSYEQISLRRRYYTKEKEKEDKNDLTEIKEETKIYNRHYYKINKEKKYKDPLDKKDKEIEQLKSEKQNLENKLSIKENELINQINLNKDYESDKRKLEKEI